MRYIVSDAAQIRRQAPKGEKYEEKDNTGDNGVVIPSCGLRKSFWKTQY